MKVDVIPNRLERHMALILNENLVFIDNMQFVNSSLEKLVQILSGDDLKYLTHIFGCKNSEFFILLKDTVKQTTDTWKIKILQNT